MKIKVDDQVVDLSALDFSPACEYGTQPSKGTRVIGCRGQNPAVWFVLKKPRCEHDVDYFTCDPCWALRNSKGTVWCAVCGWSAPWHASILRLERVRP